MKWLAELALKIFAPELVKELLRAIKEWLAAQALKLRKKKINEGIDENDSEKVEENLGSVNAGKPSDISGVQRRKRD